MPLEIFECAHAATQLSQILDSLSEASSAFAFCPCDKVAFLHRIKF